MKKSKQPLPAASRESVSGKRPKSNYSLLPVIIFLTGTGVLMWLLFSTFRLPPTSVTETPPTTNQVVTTAPPTVASSEPTDAVKPLPAATRQKLLGSWQRTDADYAIEIRLVNEDCVTDARYFNPFNQRSINVAKATLTEQAGGAEFFMELRDVGYPGSTYTLRYDEPSDSFSGIYYQAAMQQSYDVSFQRLRGQ